MKLTSIITVNYNQPDVTLEFLKSVRENASRDDVEVILVDNGCLEDHSYRFKQTYPGLVYINSEKNLGFAGGNNLGIRQAKGDYLLLLNNDTEIAGNLVSEMRTELENDPSIGMISPLIIYYSDPDIIQYAGFTEMNYITCRNHGIGSFARNTGQFNNDSRQTAFCHGAAMMCSKANMDEVGVMTESYFLYYEELDWCERFKKAGKKIWFTGKTHIFHKESMSVGKESKIKTYFMTRNRMLFIRRNTGTFNTILFSLYYILIACPKQVFLYFRKGRRDLIKWVWRGIWWNLTHSKNNETLGFKF